MPKSKTPSRNKINEVLIVLAVLAATAWGLYAFTTELVESVVRVQETTYYTPKTMEGLQR